MDLIKFKIVTPEKVVYESDVEQLTLPTMDGQITVLPHHIPLMSIIASGELIIRKNGQDIHMAVSSGFVQVNKDEVVVLADTAERAEEIDEARAQEARERASKRMSEMRDKEDVNYAALAAKMEKEIARLHVARKHKQRPPQIRTEE